MGTPYRLNYNERAAGEKENVGNCQVSDMGLSVQARTVPKPADWQALDE